MYFLLHNENLKATDKMDRLKSNGDYGAGASRDCGEIADGINTMNLDDDGESGTRGTRASLPIELPSVALLPKVLSCHFCGTTENPWSFEQCRYCEVTLLCRNHRNAYCSDRCAHYDRWIHGENWMGRLCAWACYAAYIEDWNCQESTIKLCEKACNRHLWKNSHYRTVRRLLINAHIKLGQLEEAYEAFEKYIKGQYTQAFDGMIRFVISVREWVQLEKYVKLRAKVEFEAFEDVLDEFDVNSVQGFLKRNQPAMDLIKKYLHCDSMVEYRRNETLKAQEMIRVGQPDDNRMLAHGEEVNNAVQNVINNRHDDELFKDFLRNYYY